MTATRPPRTTSLLDVAKENLEREAAAGNEVRKWRGLGYHGLSCGSVSFGVGANGVLARLSSAVAQENWKTLFQWGSNCTRIDLQATVRLNSNSANFIASRWEEARAHWLNHKHLSEPHLRSGPNGAQTIELGSRQSERCGRIYDKFVESKLDHYKQAVRFEAEFKGKVSNTIVRALVQDSRPFPDVIPHVLGFFRKQRVNLELAKHEPVFLKVPTTASDRSRKLIYLQNCIKPIVLALISSGGRDEVLSALGLSASLELDQVGPHGPKT